jgi:hypothetical protein
MVLGFSASVILILELDKHINYCQYVANADPAEINCSKYVREVVLTVSVVFQRRKLQH